MRKSLILLLLMTVSTVVMAAERKIDGIIVDRDTKEAVAMATVQLLTSDSTYVTGGLTDENGLFIITAPANGKYLLRVSNVGYATMVKKIEIADNQNLNMGKLDFAEEAVMLEGITATAMAKKVVVVEDTFIYNSAAYKTPEGSAVEELIRLIPGAKVDDSGNITINGKTVKKIKMDGKEFMNGDTQTAIKNLPTAIVEQVKAYEAKSDRSRITGIDDGEDEMTLDFSIKRGMNKGVIGHLDLGYGTHDRYAERMMLGMFKDNLRMMSFGNFNNVNNIGFGGRGGGFGRNRNGLNTANMVGVNFNYEKKDLLKWDGSVRWNHNTSNQYTKSSSENFVIGNRSFSNSLSQNYSKDKRWNAQMRFEWTPDSMTNILFRPSFSYSDNDSRSGGISATFDKDPFENTGYRYTVEQMDEILAAMEALGLAKNSRTNSQLSYGDSKNVRGRMQINRKLNTAGRNIGLNIDANYTTSNNKSLSTQNVRLYQVQDKDYSINPNRSLGRICLDLLLPSCFLTALVRLPASALPFHLDVARYAFDETSAHLLNNRTKSVKDSNDQFGINRWNLTPSTNWNYSAELSYSEPIAQKTYLQFSYKFTNSYSKSDRSTYDFSDFSALPADYAHLLASLGINNIPDYRRWDYYVLSNYEDFYDQSVSRFSEYSNYTHDIELQFRRVRDNYNFNFGVLAQPQHQVFRQRYLSTTTDRARSVFNVSPTADFRYHFTKQHQLRFRYRGRTAQPSMESMLEITDNSDPMNITVGNPNLKPSFTNNFNLFYNNYIISYSRNILFGMGFSNTRNATVRSVAYDNVTGARTNTYQNINGNWNADVWAEYSQSLDSIGRWFVTTHPEYNYSNNVGLVALNRNADPQKSITRVHNIGERLSGSFRNSWSNVDIDGNVNYIHSTNDTQPSANLDTWSFAYGGSMQITLPWNTQLSTDMHMRSRRGYNDASLNTNELIWNIQVSQSFLRAKNLVVYLQFYDILQNQSNLTRVINERMRSDTEYNSINSFAMLRISYRFQTMGGKSSREHMRPTDGRPDFSRPEFRGSGGQHGSGGPPPVHGGGFGG